MRKIKRVIGYTLGIAMVLIAAIFLLNLHLTKRLERYLRKELIHRTAEATDGFYRLSFDNLSISFFKGELTLDGNKAMSRLGGFPGLGEEGTACRLSM